MADISATDAWTGDHLVDQGIISLDDLDGASALARRWNLPLTDVLIARSAVDSRTLYASLANRFSVPHVDLIDEPPDPALLREDEIDEYMRELTMPWRRQGKGPAERLVIVTARPGPDAILHIRRRWGPDSAPATSSPRRCRTASPTTPPTPTSWR